jgi:hypothetical protein
MKPVYGATKTGRYRNWLFAGPLADAPSPAANPASKHFDRSPPKSELGAELSASRRLVDVLRETLQRVEQTSDASRDDAAFVEWKRTIMEWISALERADSPPEGPKPLPLPPKPPADPK